MGTNQHELVSGGAVGDVLGETVVDEGVEV